MKKITLKAIETGIDTTIVIESKKATELKEVKQIVKKATKTTNKTTKMDDSKKYVQLCYDEVTRETEKAILVEGSWIPKSQLLVVLNNKYYDIDAEEVRECKEKTPYCYLLPLWLHMKNNLSYKSSYKLEKWREDLNIDMRVKEQYEVFKIMSYKEYKEI